MTSLITQPQLLATAAEDASAIGSAITQAEAAAAGPTTGLVAAAEDEVSAITAQVFGGYGQEYQALLHQAAAFHHQTYEPTPAPLPRRQRRGDGAAK